MSDHSVDLRWRAGQRVPLFLVGFMGADKSTIGKTLAKRLSYEFHDTDALVESAAGRSIPEIFAHLGEPEFRRLEREALKSFAGQSRAVAALGGGAFIPDENRRIIGEIGISIWIDCPLDLCWSRVSKETNRPLLRSYLEMAALLEARLPAYRQADLTIEIGARPPARVVREIIELLGLGR